jgi:hypothetical protein
VITGGRTSRKHNEGDRKEEERQRSSSLLSQTKCRQQATTSFAYFSTKKGHDCALREYKKRKETKFLMNAMLLRGYQRAMKREGYDTGRSASCKWHGEGGRGQQQ